MTDLVYSVTASKVEGVDREMVLPLLLGRGFVVFESALYSLADKLIAGYEGGFWDVFDITEDGDLKSVFFVPTGAAVVSVESLGFQRTVETTARAAGAALTLMAFSNLSFALVNKGAHADAEKMANAYHALREFVGYSEHFTDEEKKRYPSLLINR